MNELSQCFEVMDRRISTKEKLEIVDHYTQHLANSEYRSERVREVIESGLKGVIKKEKMKD